MQSFDEQGHVPTLEDEVVYLRQRVQSLEESYESVKQTMFVFEAALADLARDRRSTPQPPPPPPPPEAIPRHEADRNRRKAARISALCAPNRNGNALCSWHDHRREKRAHAPYEAPPGVANCGCTHEEILLEESLARHGVGSLTPSVGEVRLDAGMRNALFRLLNKTYGYKDGDFEYEREEDRWEDGESMGEWERKAREEMEKRELRRATKRPRLEMEKSEPPPQEDATSSTAPAAAIVPAEPMQVEEQEVQHLVA
jgi:hypothetical protein